MRRAVLLLLSCATLAMAIASPAQTFTTLYNFQMYTDGSEPWGSLVQGADNSFYGETYMGGLYGSGTVFKITPKGALTTLHSFNQNDPNEPQAPWGGLAQGADGNFYGVSASGGLYHAGTVFKVTPGGVMTTVYMFCWGQNCVSGWAPSSALALGLDGNFYGTTPSDGNVNCSAGCGTVFKITPSGDISVLHKFNDVDGAGLKSRLLRVSDGSFYSTTVSGGMGFCPGSNGNDGCGVAFRITPEGTFSTIYTFCKQEYCPDGAIPQAGLIQGSDGNFYGTTTYDPVNACGTIFKLTPQGALTTLHTFDRTHGCKPMGELLQGPDGNFYGTTYYGGAADYGTVFRMSPSLSFTVLHEFCTQKPCSDDSWPKGGLTLGNDGLIYGATFDGGINGIGTIFTVDAGFKPLSVIKTGSGTIIGGDGKIYCGSTCSYVYAKDKQLEFTPIPGPGSTFGGWTGCDNVQGTYCLVKTDNPRTLTATFNTSQVTLTSLVLKPSTVKGGQLSAAALTLSAPAPEGGLGVSIASSVPGAAHPPSWIVVPTGKTTAGFAVRTFPVKSNTLVNISASTGASQVSAMLTVTNGRGSNQPAKALGFSPPK